MSLENFCHLYLSLSHFLVLSINLLSVFEGNEFESEKVRKRKKE